MVEILVAPSSGFGFIETYPPVSIAHTAVNSGFSLWLAASRFGDGRGGFCDGFAFGIFGSPGLDCFVHYFYGGGVFPDRGYACEGRFSVGMTVAGGYDFAVGGLEVKTIFFPPYPDTR
jgi:hypothetical protein